MWGIPMKPPTHHTEKSEKSTYYATCKLWHPDIIGGARMTSLATASALGQSGDRAR